jgi:flagellar biosynthesis/type III secretory pathway ATPase
VDYAIAAIERVTTFLRQATDEKTPFEETVRLLKGLFN